MAIRFKQDKYSGQQYEQYEEYHRGLDATIADDQKFSGTVSRTTVPRRNQFLDGLLRKFHLNQSPLWQRWCWRWGHLNFRTKLAIVLVGSTALCTTVATQGVVMLAESRLSQASLESLESDLNSLTKNIEQTEQSNRVLATSLAAAVEASGLDLTNKEDVLVSRQGERILILY